VPVGQASYGGWSDCDIAQAEAVWCVVAHLRPGSCVVETGVAHGVTTRVILEGLDRMGRGHLWSIGLPAVDPALHWQIGGAVRPELRSRWTYIEGTSRERLARAVTDHLSARTGPHRALTADPLINHHPGSGPPKN
jgi:hypothetical protein